MQQHKQLILLLILSALMAFTSLSTDIYLPAMPVMAKDLQGNAELTVTGFLLGFALAQLLWGPISDRIGRKKPLFIGMVLFVMGSVGCAMSTSIEQIVLWRVFQAFGACTGPMLARAMIRDLFNQTHAVQMLSTLTMIMAVAPIVAPLLGGQLIRFYSWHSIFWLLAMVGVLMFVALFRLPETHPAQRRASTSLWQNFRNYGQLLRNGRFMRYTLSVTFFYVAAYAFIVGSPQVYIEHFGVSPQHYGWLFALNIVGIMIMSFANRSLVKHIALNQLLRYASLIAALASLVFAYVAYTAQGGLVAIVVSVWFVFAMNGIIASCATVSALDAVSSERVGSASALMGSLQYGSGMVSSLLLAIFADGTAWTMAWIMAVFVGLCAAMVWGKKVG